MHFIEHEFLHKNKPLNLYKKTCMTYMIKYCNFDSKYFENYARNRTQIFSPLVRFYD